MYQLRPSRSCKTGMRVVVAATRSGLGLGLGLTLALALGACATEPAYRQQVAGPAQQIARAPSVEVEDDGLPAQTPPPSRDAREADDPSEPFSPNYGGKTVATSPRVVSSLTTSSAGRATTSAQN